MIINAANLGLMFEGLQLVFNRGVASAGTAWQRIAMKVPSTTTTEQYGWLADIADFREWLGPRVINNLATSGYTIVNRDFELTIGIDRNAIEDDRYGVYSPRFELMGRRAAERPDALIFELLASAFSALCYDGQNFFDTDHPVKNAQGATVSVSNTGGGSGEPWYLLDVSQPIKPFIYQERKPFTRLVAKDRPEDDNVFMNKEFLYGMDGRANAGFGLWQLAYGSKDTLSAEHYAEARTAMMRMTGDYGRKLGIVPGLLLVGPENESAARKLLRSEFASGGETNEWRDSAELLVSPWVGG